MFGIDFDDVGTRLRDLFTLKQPLRADAAANPDDVTRVKRRLKDEGFFKTPDYGATPYPDKPLFEGIKGFQKAHDLKIDGIMNPGGETQTKMNDLARARRARQEEAQTPLSFPLLSTVTPAQAGVQERSALDSGLRRNDADMDEPPEHAIIRDYLLARNKQANPAPEPKRKPERTPEPQATLPPLPKHKPDTPERKSIQSTYIHGVDDDVLISEIISHEGSTTYLYKDTARDGGKVTIGNGIMLPDVEAAKRLPLEIADKSVPSGYRRATPEEIERAFNKVDAIKQPGKKEEANSANNFDPKSSGFNLDDIRLPEKEAKKILKKKLNNAINIVREKFRNRDMDFDSFPPHAQKVFLDLQYNSGLNLENSWSELIKYTQNRDWKNAAGEVRRNGVSEERNQWAIKQMLMAQDWEDFRKKTPPQ